MYDLESNILKKVEVNAKQIQKAMRQISPDNHLNVLAIHAVHAQKKYGINVLWIVAHAATETGWGKSLIARTRNNFFGFNAIDSNPRNATKYKNAQASVEHYCDFLKQHYLTKGGKYYNGPTPHGVMTRYASAGDRAAKTIVQIMNMLAERIGPAQPDGFPIKKDEKKPAKPQTTAESEPEKPEKPEKPAEEPEPEKTETNEEKENEPTEPETPEPTEEPASDDDSKKN